MPPRTAIALTAAQSRGMRTDSPWESSSTSEGERGRRRCASRPMREPVEARKVVRKRSTGRRSAVEAVHQQNGGEWSTQVLNAPGPPRGVVVPVVLLVQLDPP